MTTQKFERMEGLSPVFAAARLEESIRLITAQLLMDGFDDNDIKQYLERVVDFVVDEVVDPL